MLQTVFTQGLANQSVAIVEHLAAIVFAGTVDAVWPHVLVVTIEL